jgi:hypothetical protein
MRFRADEGVDTRHPANNAIDQRASAARPLLVIGRRWRDGWRVACRATTSEPTCFSQTRAVGIWVARVRGYSVGRASERRVTPCTAGAGHTCTTTFRLSVLLTV